jgi:hypothetical protein
LKKELLLQKKLDLLHENEMISGKKKMMKHSQSLEKNSVGENIQNAQNAVLVKIKNESTTKKSEQNQLLRNLQKRKFLKRKHQKKSQVKNHFQRKMVPLM